MTLKTATISKMVAGEPTGGFDVVFANEVYNGCPIFQHRDFFEFYMSTYSTITSTDRWEYVVTGNDGNITASMAVYKDNDMHVGECLSVLVAFSTDDHSLFGGYRWLMKLAKKLKIPFVAYTRKTGDFTMDLVYKKVL
ncbi:hypothetical protein PQC38_gp099 [Aeromonas phage BUCT695]|uniref:hypothetical protein n=1 Tax=Aeromonas phage BUCT695 TaxID=2908630 RepID=UPI0023294683|nr:hypothetical protein PQC38_gp099 [Aeromonas phage BUCT695]UIW10575.1 hypothetical protein [Aeromonas phage BUCT695]